MVQSRTKSLTGKKAKDSVDIANSIQRSKTDSKRLSFEGEIARKKKMGVEELRLSRVDVRERQQQFEKIANKQNKPHAERSRSEDNHKIKPARIEPRGKSESVDRINEMHPKKKKLSITATSSKRKTPTDKTEKINNVVLSKKQDNNTPKAWVQPLQREWIDAVANRADPIPIPAKENKFLLEKARKPIPVEKERSNTEQESSHKKSNLESASHATSLNRGKSQSMIITVAARSSHGDIAKSDGKKAIVRVNSKASEKSNRSAKIQIKTPERSKPKSVTSRKREETQSVKKTPEVNRRPGDNTKDRKESSSSYYRDVRENLGDQKTSSSSRNELLADILSVENSEMAKALGLSEELIELIKEEEQFWNRQVELKKWRESQEKRYRDISRVYDTEKEKRIAQLRKEHDERKSIDGKGKKIDLDVEVMRLAEEQFLAEEAKRLVRQASKEKTSKKEESPKRSSNGAERKIFLKQYSVDGKTFEDETNSRKNDKRFSFPPQNRPFPSNAKTRYSDISSNQGVRNEYLSRDNSDFSNRKMYNENVHTGREKFTVNHKDDSHTIPAREKPQQENISHSAADQHRENDHVDHQRPRRSVQGSYNSDSRNSEHGFRYYEEGSRRVSKEFRYSDHDSGHTSRGSRYSDQGVRYYNKSSSSHRNDYSDTNRPIGENVEPVAMENSQRSKPGRHSGMSKSFSSSHAAALVDRKHDKQAGKENDSGLDHLKGEQVFSEQCDGKVRTYHVTSVAVRYSRASSSSSSNFRTEKSRENDHIIDSKQDDKCISQSNKQMRKGDHDTPVGKRHSIPTGWFSDDDSVFVDRPKPDISSPRGCFSDDEITGEYIREKLRDAKLVRLEAHHRIRCAGCNSLIREKEAMSVAKKDIYWHIACFNCIVCGIVLVAKRGGHIFKVRIINGRLHCSNCYSTNGDKLSEV